jgi:hypothetical protein
LIDENERTFKEGMIVSATVTPIYTTNGHKSAKCRLNNGLDANVNQIDIDDF